MQREPVEIATVRSQHERCARMYLHAVEEHGVNSPQGAEAAVVALDLLSRAVAMSWTLGTYEKFAENAIDRLKQTIRAGLVREV